jgi:hypothetical protein
LLRVGVSLRIKWRVPTNKVFQGFQIIITGISRGLLS